MKISVIGMGIALAAELISSWWTWVRAPTDTLRVRYDSFFAYEGERFLSWLVVVVFLNALWLLSRRARS
jgi:hypothetical protein